MIVGRLFSAAGNKHAREYYRIPQIEVYRLGWLGATSEQMKVALSIYMAVCLIVCLQSARKLMTVEDSKE